MGVSGFTKFFGETYVEKNINDYRGKKLIIDAYQVIYKQYIGRCNLPNNSRGYLVYGHLDALFKFTMNMLMIDIKPIYVFDGTPPEEKTNITNERNRIKDRAVKFLDKDDYRLKENIKRAFRINKKVIDDCKKLLNYMGVCYITSSIEADYLCAHLSKMEYFDGIISDDTDMLLYGGKNIIKNFSFKYNLKEVSLENILKFLNNLSKKFNNKEITFKDFINFSILLGTDYNYNNNEKRIFLTDSLTIFKYFCLNDYNIIKTYNSLKEDKYVYFTELKNLLDISNIYENEKPINNLIFNNSKMNIGNLINFLCRDNPLNIKMIKSRLLIYLKAKKKLTKYIINKYFNNYKI